MVKGIIEKTHIISSKITKFIWILSMCKFLKSNKYYETEGVIGYELSLHSDLYTLW